MTSDRKTLAMLEFLYKYKAITKEMLMNMFYADWTISYRTLTGIARDSTIKRKLDIARNTFPNTLEYVNSLTTYTALNIVEKLANISKGLSESYSEDIQKLTKTYITKE